jgi:hypothetical protein
MAVLSASTSPSTEQLKAAADQDRLYSILGLIIGALIVAAGIYLLFAGLGGTSGTIKIPVPGSTGTIDISASPVGLVVVIVGAAFVWMTRPTVAS